MKVTVTGPTITVNKEELTLPVLSSEQLKVSGLVPNDAVDSWESYDTYVATVDDDGIVTAKHGGDTSIRIRLLSGLEAEVPVHVAPATITLTPVKITMSIFGSEQIEVSNLVAGDKVVSWKSSNENVAMVDENGLVTAKAPGEAEIIAKTLSDIEASIHVRITEPAITLSPAHFALPIFGTKKIEVSDLVEGDKVVSWTSTDESVATVDQTGLVTAKSAGSADIIVKLLSGKEASAGVFVEKPYLRLSTDSFSLQVTESETISVRDHVEGDEIVSYTSEDSSVAEVDSSGKVTAKKIGQTVITVTMKSGITGRVHVNVYHQTVKCRIEPSNVISVGGKAKIVTEGLLEGEKILYTVDDPSVASIDEDGNITALEEGTTEISLSFDAPVQIEGSLSIRVIDPIVIPDSNSITIKEGETRRIRVGLTEGDGVSSFTSANPDVAAVDSKGNVTGVSAGKTKVTVTLRSGLTGDVEVTVEREKPLKEFDDVTDPTAFYYDPIYWAVDEGITTGYSDNTFRPFSECHRAAVVTFLWRLAGKPEPDSMASFTDMTGNSDFDKAISWASQKGITTGYKDNTFRPYNPCNRAAIVTFLWRYAGCPQPNSMAAFNDMTGNSDFDKAISWAYENDITTGYAGNLFKPWNTCNRMAVVTFLYRLQ